VDVRYTLSPGPSQKNSAQQPEQDSTQSSFHSRYGPPRPRRAVARYLP
jgi:hypothetical protein